MPEASPACCGVAPWLAAIVEGTIDSAIPDATRMPGKITNPSALPVGWILVSNGRQDLWKLAYLEANQGSCYVLGDEVRFLLGQPSATPTPLREDDRDDVA